MKSPKLLDTVATLAPIPGNRLELVEPEYALIDLPSGLVGTIVEIYAGENTQYLVEFADLQGREYAMATLKENEFLILHHELTSFR